MDNNTHAAVDVEVHTDSGQFIMLKQSNSATGRPSVAMHMPTKKAVVASLHGYVRPDCNVHVFPIHTVLYNIDEVCCADPTKHSITSTV